ncbi:MAG: hypothetical protein PF636_05875, partial [Actinomycetota bacterium]|nr:hypothetical protein [Actinomycetota bacterium]
MLTELDIGSASPGEEENAVIRDAAMRLRGMLRGQPSTVMLEKHNEEYGFIRNLYGLTPVWIVSTAFCSLVAAIEWFRGDGTATLLGIQIFFLVSALLYAVAGKR